MASDPVPEHPDAVRERRRELLNFAFGISAIGLMVGALLIVLAFSADTWWMGPSRPKDVEYAIWSEYRVGGGLVGLSVAIMFVSWYVSRYLEAARGT